MAVQLQPSQPRQARVVHNLTWEQLEEIDRSLEDFPGVRLALQIHHLREAGYEVLKRSELLPRLPLVLFRRYITYHDQYDAVREFRQALRQGLE